VAFDVDHAVEAAVGEVAGEGVHVAVGVAGGGGEPADVAEEIVVPLGLEADVGVEGVVFGDAEDVGMVGDQPLVDLLEHVAAGLVPGSAAMADVVDRIPAEAVDVVVLDEHLDLGLDEILDLGAAVVGPGGTPVGGGLPGLVVEEDAAEAVLRPAVELPHLEVGRAVVVVDDVDEDGDAGRSA